MRLLGLYVDTYIHVVLFTDKAQLHVGIVAILRALGVTAQAGAEIIPVGIFQIAEEARKLAVVV